MKPADKIVVAIDGGAGTGTSTAAEGVARTLDLPHLNTGSMYRALAWEATRQGLDLNDETACTLLAETAEMELDGGTVARINGHDVRKQLYAEGMGPRASDISGLVGVRRAMVQLQRAIALERGAVMEGRDIGTNVFPDTPHKFFFTCDPKERMRRVNAGGRHHETVKSLLARDAADEAHAHGTFKRHEEAIAIDTTNLTAAEVIATIIERVIKTTGRTTLQD